MRETTLETLGVYEGSGWFAGSHVKMMITARGHARAIFGILIEDNQITHLIRVRLKLWAKKNKQENI